MARGKSSCKLIGCIICNVQIAVQVLEDVMPEHAWLPSCMGFGDCNSWMGWTNQIIPELWITSSPLNRERFSTLSSKKQWLNLHVIARSLDT
jgi:hypothetical protein